MKTIKTITIFLLLLPLCLSKIWAAYCSSSGTSTADEWIASFAFSTLNNVSGNNSGYGNYTAVTVNVNKSASYSFTCTPGFSGSSYPQWWRIWIDYNGDTDFADAGELAYDAGTTSTTSRTGTITIPAGAATGVTRMRVSMKYNAAPTSCETFSYGEVEDYSINIIAACSDSYESNEVQADSKTISVNTNISARICTPTDWDWFKFNNSAGAPNIKIDLTTLPFDYDIFLFNSVGTVLGWSTHTGTTNEQIIYNTSTVATYYVRVSGYAGAYSTSSNYTLRASTSGSAWRLAPLDDDGIKDAEAAMAAIPGALRGMLHPNPAYENVTLQFASPIESQGTLVILDATGKQVHTENVNALTGTNEIKLDVDALSGGIYFVQLRVGDYTDTCKLNVVK